MIEEMVEIPLDNYLARLEQIEIDLAMLIVEIKQVMKDASEAVYGEE